jgi:hypothetical protein
MRARIRPLALVALFATSQWLIAGYAHAQSAGYPPAIPVRPSAPAAAPGAVSTAAPQAPAAPPTQTPVPSPPGAVNAPSAVPH